MDDLGPDFVNDVLNRLTSVEDWRFFVFRRKTFESGWVLAVDTAFRTRAEAEKQVAILRDLYGDKFHYKIAG